MPINIPPEAQVAWDRYQQASGTSERIELLEEYMRLVPKHKGVEKHIKQCKVTLSRLRDELQKEKMAKKGTGEKWMVPKEGDAQMCAVGLPNSGKSSFINFLVGKEALDVADYPFTTIKPDVGSIQVEGARLQLVDLPALIEGSSEGTANGGRVFAQIRNADLLLVLIDLSENPVQQFQVLIKEFHNAKIRLNTMESFLRFERTGKGGLVIINPENYFGGRDSLIELLHTLKVTNCRLILNGPTTEDELIEHIRVKTQILKAVVIATKGDLPKSKSNFSKLKNYLKDEYQERFRLIPVSVKFQGKKNINNPEKITEDLFQQLDRIRIYTRNDKGEVALKPIVLKSGSTVADVAERLGKLYVKHFRYSKIWGPSVKFDATRAGFDHILFDRDQVQIFT
ncbi:MAG: GTPase [Candidatus Hodarchaeales archaeon]|jgi:ribosome-interacting GTPase 1